MVYEGWVLSSSGPIASVAHCTAKGGGVRVWVWVSVWGGVKV